jgi:hypothetical protein
MRGAELAEKFVRSVVREAQISTDDFLVEHRSAQKTPHLLLFYRIARRCENVTSAGKDCAGNPPIERGKKGEHALFKGENGIAAPQLDVIGGNDAINVGRVDAQRPDGIV